MSNELEIPQSEPPRNYHASFDLSGLVLRRRLEEGYVCYHLALPPKWYGPFTDLSTATAALLLLIVRDVRRECEARKFPDPEVIR